MVKITEFSGALGFGDYVKVRLQSWILWNMNDATGNWIINRSHRSHRSHRWNGMKVRIPVSHQTCFGSAVRRLVVCCPLRALVENCLMLQIMQRFSSVLVSLYQSSPDRLHLQVIILKSYWDFPHFAWRPEGELITEFDSSMKVWRWAIHESKKSVKVWERLTMKSKSDEGAWALASSNQSSAPSASSMTVAR